jgi:hypothetical protein
MGSGVGVHNPNDLQNLTAGERLELKREVIRQLQSPQISALTRSDPQAAADIAEIVQTDPTFLEIFMARHPAIQSQVQQLVAPVLRRLKGQ